MIFLSFFLGGKIAWAHSFDFWTYPPIIKIDTKHVNKKTKNLIYEGKQIGIIAVAIITALTLICFFVKIKFFIDLHQPRFFHGGDIIDHRLQLHIGRVGGDDESASRFHS